MARFFFDTQSELGTRLDTEGCEYPNADVARSEAANAARSRAAERVRTGTGLYDETIIVRDDRGEVSRMTLAEAVASVLFRVRQTQQNPRLKFRSGAPTRARRFY
jgi:hypothetical protein